MPNWLTTTLACIGGILAPIGVILGWWNKLRWAKEYKEAKEEVIRVKDSEIQSLKSHIEQLRHLNPETLKDHAIAIQELLEQRRVIEKEYSEEEVRRAKVQIKLGQDKILQLTTEGKGKDLLTEELKGKVTNLESKLDVLSAVLRPEKRAIKPDFVQLGSGATEASEELRRALSTLGVDTPSANLNRVVLFSTVAQDSQPKKSLLEMLQTKIANTPEPAFTSLNLSDRLKRIISQKELEANTSPMVSKESPGTVDELKQLKLPETEPEAKP